MVSDALMACHPDRARSATRDLDAWKAFRRMESVSTHENVNIYNIARFVAVEQHSMYRDRARVIDAFVWDNSVFLVNIN